MSFRIDFHVHTINSNDSINRPRTIIRRANRCGLDAVVVLDHETIKGGQATATLNAGDLIIIPAVEIKTDIGDIVGLFVRREINAREYHAVIEAIKKQAGLVMLPHPYHKHTLPDDLFELIDLVEINNARISADKNRAAVALAAT